MRHETIKAAAYSIPKEAKNPEHPTDLESILNTLVLHKYQLHDINDKLNSFICRSRGIGFGGKMGEAVTDAPKPFVGFIGDINEVQIQMGDVLADIFSSLSILDTIA